MTPVLHIHLLGEFRLNYDDAPLTTVNTARLQSLLAYLVLHHHAPQARQSLAFLLWPNSSEAQAQSNFRTLLHRFRQALPAADQFLEINGHTLQWRAEAPFTLDVADFERAVAQQNSRTTLQRAIELYRGDLWPGCYDDWLLLERERLRLTFGQALEQLILLLENERDYHTAILYAQRLLQHYPLHEATYRRLMRLYGLDGDLATVQQIYHNCFKTLQSELGVDPSPATRQVYEHLKTMELPTAQHHNLPVSLTPFVGRQEELARITTLLTNPACRLLTLVGPGGIGKTRLAIRAARLQIGCYLDGIYFVSCVAIGSIELLPATIAEALKFSFRGPNEPKTQLLNYLRQKELLLVIDNFEHLLAGTELLLEILRGAPSLKLLLTSRERLNVPAEWLLEVQGLSVPPVCLCTRAEENVESYDAATLFLQSVRRLHRGFTLSGQTESQVGCLCRLVQGMPLALELAAPWARMLSCAEMVHEIERDLDFLARSGRDSLDRHHSIRAIFDHSWGMLSAEEQRVLACLSVFRGGFGRAAAHQVAGASLATLSALVDKSLLCFNPLGRYDLHELLRQYAFEWLGEMAEEKVSTQERHSHYYLEFMRQQTHPLYSHRQGQALLEVLAEVDNVRAAWHWAVAHGQAREIGRAVRSWSMFYDIQGWYQEGEIICRETIDMLTRGGDGQEGEDNQNVEAERDRHIVLGQMLAAYGEMLLRSGSLGRSKALFQQSVTVLRQYDAPVELANTLFYAGSLAQQMGEYAEAKTLLQESLALHQDCGDQRGVGLCLAVLGLTAGMVGNYAEAKTLMQQGADMLKMVGDPCYLAIVLNFLGNVMTATGELAAAKYLLEESLAISRALGDRWNQAFCLDHLGAMTFMMGAEAWPEAKRLYQESLAISQELGEQDATARSLNHLGQVTYAQAEFQESEQYFSTALEIAMAGQVTPVTLDALAGLLTLLVNQESETANSGLTSKEKAIEVLVVVLNHPALMHETKEKADQLLTELESVLPSEMVESARARGATQTLEAIAKELLTAWPD